MKIYRVPADDGYYRIGLASDVEYVNPIEYFSSQYIEYSSSTTRDILLLKKVQVPIDEINHFAVKRSITDWKEHYNNITKTEVSPNLISLLASSSKKDQVKLLKNLSLTPSVLLSFIFKAWIEYGFSFSQYIAHHHHKGLDKEQLPRLIELKKDRVIKIGDTNLTDGQLKNVVEHRKVVVSKFLDKDENWHCFFTTFRSLNKKENWKDGQPHFHYISNKFGLPRDQVVAQLKSENYNLGNLPHIELKGYRESEEQISHDE